MGRLEKGKEGDGWKIEKEAKVVREREDMKEKG